MSLYGTYKGLLGFMEGVLYVGEKDGEPRVEMSFLPIGMMHEPGMRAAFGENEVLFYMDVNGFDGEVRLKPEGDSLKGELFIEPANMRFPVEISKISDEYEFCEKYFEIPAENVHILRENGTFEEKPASVMSDYELGNQDVLKKASEMGIETENHQDFATIRELMLLTEKVIHQDGVNYCHAEEHGTLAQLKKALEQNNHTNCRGISIIYSGILRAYGFRSSYVECWPVDPESNEIHVVCEVYAPDLQKFVMVDISNRMIFFQENVPLSLFELRQAIAGGDADQITTNPEARISLGECLAYLSKNLVVLRKQLHNNEKDEILRDNSIALVPCELKEEWGKAARKNAVLTSNPADFYRR